MAFKILTGVLGFGVLALNVSAAFEGQWSLGIAFGSLFLAGVLFANVPAHAADRRLGRRWSEAHRKQVPQRVAWSKRPGCSSR